jgi:diguanylate cyclase (GGDEF)-like protein
VAEGSRADVAAHIERATAGTGDVDVEFKIVRSDGAVRTVHSLGGGVVDEFGVVTRMFGTCQDITERRMLEDEVQFRAFHDPLTGLANRALLIDRLDHAIARRLRSDSSLALLFLDLDDFKMVNDTLGHSAGDELLIEVGRRLSATLRPSDTMARLGGDEFAILLEDADAEVAESVAARIQSVLAQPMRIQQQEEVVVRSSIGVLVADGKPSADEMLRDVDIAMYQAKLGGKNSYEIFESTMRGAVIDRMKAKADLRASLDNDEFVLHFQPIVDLPTGEIRGMEALVRWEHPERGLVSPADFIPLAEESGLIVPLGTWVIQEGTRKAKELQDATGQEFSLSVNLSAKQLSQSDLVAIVSDALDASGLAASDLILELTESVLLEGSDKVQHVLTDLRDLGVRIAIDDFGTGYSSLAYLRRFPVDILKIDRSFISGVTEGPEESALAEAVVKLASILNLETVAEGVETEAQRAKLSMMGCHAAQGFLFARPAPSEVIEKKLTELLGQPTTSVVKPRRGLRVAPVGGLVPAAVHLQP